MRRLITLAVLVAALASVSSASAITDGTADGNGHPNVGGLVAPTAYSDGTWIYCSGTLISPTVFLTAAHCADVSDRVRVTFYSAYQDGDKTYSGTFHGDPLYNQSQSDPHDIAVVVLDKAVKGITPAQLPAANSLSNLSSTQQFTSVGYGAYEVTKGPGGHQYLYNDVRGVATGTLNSITQSWLKISMTRPTGTGHVLRRLGRPELPRDERRDRRDHDHGRRCLPLDERGLPARHGVGAELPLAVRRAAVARSAAA